MVKTRKASALASIVSEERPLKRIKAHTVADPAEIEESSSCAKPKRKTTHRKNADIIPILERQDNLWKVGAHVSAAGGVENAIVNAASVGANAFAIFVKSQRKWSSPPLKSTTIDSFKSRMKEYGYQSQMVLPHGSYLINLGNPDAEKRQKSYGCFLDDLKRCEELGLELYNFHPGSTVGSTTTANSISLIAGCINRAHKETNYITTVLENMAGTGNIVGSDFSHLADIIAKVEDKTRIAVCLDTCHMFAAGYDIRTKEGWDATLKSFDSQVGLTYLKAMHLNDSKTGHNSKKDRHENIGIGHVGLQAFYHILNDPRVQNIPLVLETPSFELPQQVWTKEIEVLNKLSGLDFGLEELKEMTEDIRTTVKQAEKTNAKVKPKVKRRQKGKAKGDESDDQVGDEADDNDGHIH